jgi:hypothetical protein
MVERAAAAAGLELKAHPMLRHACGYALANQGISALSGHGYPGCRT